MPLLLPGGECHTALHSTTFCRPRPCLPQTHLYTTCMPCLWSHYSCPPHLQHYTMQLQCLHACRHSSCTSAHTACRPHTHHRHPLHSPRHTHCVYLFTHSSTTILGGLAFTCQRGTPRLKRRAFLGRAKAPCNAARPLISRNTYTSATCTPRATYGIQRGFLPVRLRGVANCAGVV